MKLARNPPYESMPTSDVYIIQKQEKANLTTAPAQPMMRNHQVIVTSLTAYYYNERRQYAMLHFYTDLTKWSRPGVSTYPFRPFRNDTI